MKSVHHTRMLEHLLRTNRAENTFTLGHERHKIINDGKQSEVLPPLDYRLEEREEEERSNHKLYKAASTILKVCQHQVSVCYITSMLVSYSNCNKPEREKTTGKVTAEAEHHLEKNHVGWMTPKISRPENWSPRELNLCLFSSGK